MHIRYIHNSTCVILWMLLCQTWWELNLLSFSLATLIIPPSSPSLFQTKLPTFTLSLWLSFICLLNSLLPAGIGEVSKFGFFVLYKWREPAKRNVNQCKSIMKAIYEVCEEWQNSPCTHTHKWSHTHTYGHTTCSICCNRGKWIRFWCFKSFFFWLILKVNFTNGEVFVFTSHILQTEGEKVRKGRREDSGEKEGWIIN